MWVCEPELCELVVDEILDEIRLFDPGIHDMMGGERREESRGREIGGEERGGEEGEEEKGEERQEGRRGEDVLA